MTKKVQVAVVGAGAAGLACALGLAQNGVDVALIGPFERQFAGRTVALLGGSVDFIRELYAWPHLEPNAAALKIMRLIDDTGSLFAVPPVEFHAREIGLDAFGYNIANEALTAALAEDVKQNDIIHLPQHVSAIEQTPHALILTLADGERLAAALVIGTDGRKSFVREWAGIPTRHWSYPQLALTTILAHSRSHNNVSSEFHTRHGPCTLVPLVGTKEEPYRSSVVWLMEPEEGKKMSASDDPTFARALEKRVHFLLGDMRVTGPRGHFPMGGLSTDRLIGSRLALAGEACHAFPPIGAQGLNLGLRDAKTLIEIVSNAVHMGDDPGASAILERYQKARQRDIRGRQFGVDLLNRSLLNTLLPMDFLRGLSLTGLDHIGPLRRMAMRAGLALR